LNAAEDSSDERSRAFPPTKIAGVSLSLGWEIISRSCFVLRLALGYANPEALHRTVADKPVYLFTLKYDECQTLINDFGGNVIF
jgi:hypothetical protein